MARATNLADGTIVFRDIAIEPEWIGTTRTYHVAETVEDNDEIKYDEHIEDIPVVFSDDRQGNFIGLASYEGDGLEFTNYVLVQMPATGMDVDQVKAIAMTTLSTLLVVIGLRVLSRRRRRRRRRGE